MALYLQHYFDPEVRQRRLKPTPGVKNSLHNLGYVQNVHAGQLLAELVPADSIQEPEARFLISSLEALVGENTHLDPQNPQRLLANSNGYVTYDNNRICVLTVLKVHSDVSFETGNIIFYGDAAINGNIRAGFEVHGQNVLITGMVEGGIVRAQKALHITGGVRGGVGKHCKLTAQKDARIGFVEKAEIQCYGNIIIEKNCLHSTLYAAKNTLVKERLVGGTLHGKQGLMVAGHLGNKASTSTRIFLGYDPMHIRKLEKIENHLSSLAHDIHHLSSVAGHLAPNTNELSRKLDKARKKQIKLLKSRNHIWNHLSLDETHIGHCKVVAMGEVFAGVEIAIGQAYLYVDKPCKSVVFSLVNNEILCTPYNPVQKS